MSVGSAPEVADETNSNFSYGSYKLCCYCIFYCIGERFLVCVVLKYVWIMQRTRPCRAWLEKGFTFIISWNSSFDGGFHVFFIMWWKASFDEIFAFFFEFVIMRWKVSFDAKCWLALIISYNCIWWSFHLCSVRHETLRWTDCSLIFIPSLCDSPYDMFTYFHHDITNFTWWNVRLFSSCHEHFTERKCSPAFIVF